MSRADWKKVQSENCYGESITYEYVVGIRNNCLIELLEEYGTIERKNFRRPVFLFESIDGIRVKGLIEGETIIVRYPEKDKQDVIDAFECFLEGIVVLTSKGNTLSPEGSIKAWQLEKINMTLETAEQKSPYYRDILSGVRLKTLEDIKKLPFTNEQHLITNNQMMLCAAPSEIERIVSLSTSGTTNSRKRVSFSKSDLEHIRSYFEAGLSSIFTPGTVLLITYSCEITNGLGNLICDACEKIGINYITCDKSQNLEQVVSLCESEQVTGAVGLPRHILALSHWSAYYKIPLTIKEVLLSGDFVSAMMRDEIEKSLSCEVFTHYGSTEMGFGCAVECGEHNGLHVREKDLFIEIVDVLTGEAVEDGMWGEVVFTTLVQEAMPLVRFRTGDISRIVPGVCVCGDTSRRLDARFRRIDNGSTFGFDIVTIEEAIGSIPLLLDYELFFRKADGALVVQAEIIENYIQVLNEIRERISKVSCVNKDRIIVRSIDSSFKNGIYGGQKHAKSFTMEKRKIKEAQRIPTRQEAMDLLEEYGTPPNVIAHCEVVSKMALSITEELVQSGHFLDRSLIEVGALLHDIARVSKHHAKIGADVLRDRGWDDVADIVEVHMELPEEMAGQVSETTVVFFADKLVCGTDVVSLDERYAQKPMFEDIPVRERLAQAKRIQELFYAEGCKLP